MERLGARQEHTGGRAGARWSSGRSVARRWRAGWAAVGMVAMPFLFNGPVAAQGAGGRGPIQVILVTKGHGFDRAPFFAMFDALGESITWTHVEQPAAQVFWDPRLAEPYDVFVYYDAMGRGEPLTAPDGSTYFEEPTPEAKANLEALLKQGKGMVFFHHSIAAWNQVWPEYAEIVGGACDWGNYVNVRGEQYPFSGAQVNIEQHVSVLDPTHPVVEGLGHGFDIVDETYLCPYFEDSIHPLLRTNFDPIPDNFPSRFQRDAEWVERSRFREHPRGSNLTGWVKPAENSPIVYIQHGHGPDAWENESFLTLMRNAIRWAASEEAKAWARANPQRIF
jgi:uncharacterized protein